MTRSSHNRIARRLDLRPVRAKVDSFSPLSDPGPKPGSHELVFRDIDRGFGRELWCIHCKQALTVEMFGTPCPKAPLPA